MNLEIANRLVALRREHGLSQEDLAGKLGVSRQAVSKWERAESSPDTDNLIALARLYGISLDAMLLHAGGTGGAAGAVQYAEAPRAEEAELDDDEAVFAAADAWDAAEAEEAEARRKRIKKKLLAFPYPAVLPLLYMVLGFGFEAWHPGWIIFLTIPLYYGLIAALF